MSNIPKHLLDSIIMSKEQWEEYQKIKEEHKNCTRKHWQSKCAEHCANEKILQRQIEIMERYFELISDIGYDYDGCNSVESLKALVDELTHLASLGRACNDKEAIYTDGNNKKLNILLEETKDEI